MGKQKHQKPATVNVASVAKEPVFLYFSVCHNVQANKPPCEMPRGKGVKGFGQSPEGEATLGTWRCGGCNKPCKVTRSLNPAAKNAASRN